MTYKHMTSISKVHTDKLTDIVKQYNSIHTPIKIKHVDVESNTCINFPA